MTTTNKPTIDDAASLRFTEPGPGCPRALLQGPAGAAGAAADPSGVATLGTGADQGDDATAAARVRDAGAPTGRLLLLGAGHAHLTVLEQLARKRSSGSQPFEVTLVSPSPAVVYSGMVPGLLAGHYSIEQCTIGLADLLERSGVRFIEGRAVQLDAAAQRVRVATADGLATLPYDVLSIDTGSVMERDRLEQQIPGSRLNALFVRPIDAFAALWPQLCTVASERRLRIAVVGAGAGGVEIAMAIRFRLPTCELSLLTGGEEPLASHPKKVRKSAARALGRLTVNVLRTSCATISPQALLLPDGTLHECDVVILATGSQAPAWLAQHSDLALDERGFVAIDAQLRSLSHPNVFAAGDIATRRDQSSPKSGVHAVRQAPTLAKNLFAALSRGGLERHDPPARTLNLISCGERYAIASWGGFSFEGRWVWRLKDWIDRRYVARFNGAAIPVKDITRQVL